MEAAVKPAGISLIEQYLKTEQGAAEHMDAKSADLVEAMPFLLQVINRQAEALALAKQALDLEADAVWDVAVSVLKSIYVADANDDYRVLGLNPWCGIAEARARHRYLIRLFHPDRGMLSSADGEPDFAAIINRAYTNISNGSPSAGQHAAGTSPNNQRPKFRLSRQFEYKFKPSHKIHVAAVAAALGIYKLTPRIVWLALIMIALTFIAQKYWNNQQQIMLAEPQVDMGQTKPAGSPENTTQAVSPVADKPMPVALESNHQEMASVADFSNLNQAAENAAKTPVANPAVASAKGPDAAGNSLGAASIQPRANLQAVPEAPKNSQAPVVQAMPKANVPEVKKDIAKPVTFAALDKSVQKPVPVANDNINQTNINQSKKSVPSAPLPVTEPAQPVMPAQVARPQKTQPQKMQAEAAQPVSDNRMPAANVPENKEPVMNAVAPSVAADADKKSAAHVTQVSNAVVRAAELSNEELDRLIKNLVASYNQGDLESLMQLLEEDVKTDEPGGKNGLRQAYAKLFSKTTQREMQLRDLNWQRQGEVAITSPKYVVSVTSLTASAPKIHRGVLQFEVVRREGRPLIHAFYHLPEGNGR